MAIDDNTSYELTGAQVKDLANKIKGKAADNTFVGATPAAPGSKGLVPEPQAGDDTKFLSGDGTWQTVPTVNNGALTIQQNGTTLDTFTANSSDDKTVNIQTITAETVAPAEEVGAITSSMIADGAVTSAKIDWTSLVSTPWQSGTYASGFKASANVGFSSYGIGACIYAGFLYVRFSASRSSGDFAASTEYTIGSIPSVVGGVDVSSLTATADGNLTRSSLSAGSANCGWCNLNGTNITVELKTGSTGWCVGTIMIPLNW